MSPSSATDWAFLRPNGADATQKNAFGEVKTWSGEHGGATARAAGPRSDGWRSTAALSTLAEAQGFRPNALQQSVAIKGGYWTIPIWNWRGVYGDRGRFGKEPEKAAGAPEAAGGLRGGKDRPDPGKSISRFARNIKECIETIRRLRQLGISVWFEKEGLNTLDERADLLLNILATIAEEESNSLSQEPALGASAEGTKRGRPFGKLPYGYAVDKESSAWKNR